MPPTDPETPLLAVDSLNFTYGPTPALRDVSFTVDAGELVVLAGRNGSGKSTLLRCAAGWTRATGGEVRISGTPVQRAERSIRGRVILVPDLPAFYDELTAWEHLQFIANAQRLDDWEEQAGKLLDHFGLGHAREDFPFRYSRGMRYKLALCLALLVEPSLLLLDEPFGPLDALSADTLWNDLELYRDAGTGILLSSHQLPPNVAPDRYILLEQGALIASGSPDDLARLAGTSGIPSLEAILQSALAHQGAANLGD